MYLNTRVFPTTGNARVLLFMFIRLELGGMGTECVFPFQTVNFRTVFSASASSWRFHLLLKAEESATLVQNVDILLLSVNETRDFPIFLSLKLGPGTC